MNEGHVLKITRVLGRSLFRFDKDYGCDDAIRHVCHDVGSARRREEFHGDYRRGRDVPQSLDSTEGLVVEVDGDLLGAAVLDAGHRHAGRAQPAGPEPIYDIVDRSGVGRFDFGAIELVGRS